MAKKRRDPDDKHLLDEKLWKVFSLYIRKRDKGICFTCGNRLEIKQCQAGHFFSRGHHAIKYDEKNVHAQCLPCNVFKHGNLHEYHRNFIARYGQAAYDDLYSRKDDEAKRTVEWYKEMIEKYSE